MSRVKSMLTAGLLGVTLTMSGIGVASAEGAGWNENNGNGPKTENCVALASAVRTGNGHEIRDRAAHSVRGDEIKALQATCAGNDEAE